MFKKTILTALLATAGLSAFAADYYVVVPLQGKQALLNGISVSLNNASLPTGLVGVPYAGFDLSQALQVSGDPAYSSTNVGWSVVAGALPAGLMLNKDVISGTPTAAGEQTFSVRATYKTKTGEQVYTILTFAVTVALAAGTLPQGFVGAPYTAYDLKPLLAVSGDPSYTGADVAWSVVSSTLPAGLTLKANGTISGTPTAAGDGNLVARATYRGVNGEQTYQVVTLAITVALAAGTPPQGVVGVAYPTYDLKSLLTVSGDPSYTGADVTWAVVSSSLPAGLTLQSDGTISGTPTVAGSGAVTARATYKGFNGERAYQVVTLNITVALAPATLPFIAQGVSYTYDFKSNVSVTGDAAYNASNVGWRVASGTLPTGLALGANGVLSGTVPNTSGTSTGFTVAADYKTKTAHQSYILNSYSYDPYAAMVALYIKGDSDVNDKSANHFVPSITGGVTRFLSPDVHGSALQFNNGYLTLPNSNALKLGLNDFTVEFWMKSSTGNDTFRRIVSSTVGYFSANTFVMRHAPGVFQTIAGNAPTATPLNTWVHVAYGRTTGVGRLFVGGVLAGTWPDGTDYAEAIQYIGGYYVEGEYFSGALDEIRITNGVGRYTSNFTPVKTPYPDR